MADIYVISDTHFGHANIIYKFTPPRPFNTITEHDQALIDNWNSVVRPQDHVYHLGDVCMKKYHLGIVKKLNGHKRLVRGNHDIFRTRDYIDVGFEEIYGVRVFLPNTQQNKTGLVLTHIPLHPNHIPGGFKNVHGHLHLNKVLKEIEVETGIGMSTDFVPDDTYINVSCEQINYTPVLLESLR